MKSLAVFALGAFAVAASFSPAQALSAKQSDHLSHVAMCLNLLLSDPARHAAECGGPFENVAPTNNFDGLHNFAPPPEDECDWES